MVSSNIAQNIAGRYATVTRDLTEGIDIMALSPKQQQQEEIDQGLALP
jgi:hypothetical protein